MSEKRHRQQQRRQRRRAQARSRPSTEHRPSRSRRGDAGLDEMVAGIAEVAARDADQPEDALDAEQWGSMMLGMMRGAPLPPDEDAESMFLPGFVAALEELGTRRALATLRAVAAVSAPDYAVAARAAPDQVGLAMRDLDLAEARARAEAAFYKLDHTWDPPVTEDVRPMRALIE